IQPLCLELPRESLWIAMAVRVDIGVGKWIVCWNSAIRVESEDFSVQGTEVLGKPRGLRVAHRPVNFAVGTEFHTPAVMVVGAGDAIDKNFVQTTLTALLIFAQPHKTILQPAVGGTVGISDINKAILAKLRVER